MFIFRVEKIEFYPRSFSCAACDFSRIGPNNNLKPEAKRICELRDKRCFSNILIHSIMSNGYLHTTKSGASYLNYNNDYFNFIKLQIVNLKKSSYSIRLSYKIRYRLRQPATCNNANLDRLFNSRLVNFPTVSSEGHISTASISHFVRESKPNPDNIVLDGFAYYWMIMGAINVEHLLHFDGPRWQLRAPFDCWLFTEPNILGCITVRAAIFQE